MKNKLTKLKNEMLVYAYILRMLDALDHAGVELPPPKMSPDTCLDIVSKHMYDSLDAITSTIKNAYMKEYGLTQLSDKEDTRIHSLIFNNADHILNKEDAKKFLNDLL